MSLIIAARFDTFEHAQRAAESLMKNGVLSDDMHTFFVNPAGAHARLPMGGDRISDPGSRGASYGAFGGAAILALVGGVVGALIGFSLNNAVLPVVGGAGVGAYVGSLIGGVSQLGRNKATPSRLDAHGADNQTARSAGVLLAVRVEAAQQQRIGDLLREAGGIEIERAQGRWEGGQWRDFDPLETPDLQRDSAPPNPSATDRPNP